MAIQRKCYNSSVCGSGYACIGNECVPQFGASGMAAGQASGCGTGSTNGGTGGCSEPGCNNGGGTPPGPDPGPDGDPGGGCNGWCDSYNKANGVSGPGCGPNSGCPECFKCNVLGTAYGTCSQAVTSCKCPGGTCPDCQACGEDGVCTDASDLCETCCESLFTCSCGRTAVCRICGPVGSIGAFDCIKCAQSKCDEDCPPDPPGPEPCDCNCHDDCPECQLCGADGRCYPDPECEKDWRTTWTKAAIPYVYYGCSYSDITGGGGCVNPDDTSSTSAVDITTSCGKLPHTIVQTQGMTQTPYGPCVTGNTRTCWRVKDANGNWITSEFCQQGVSGTFCSDLDTSAPPAISNVTEC